MYYRTAFEEFLTAGWLFCGFTGMILVRNFIVAHVQNEKCKTKIESASFGKHADLRREEARGKSWIFARRQCFQPHGEFKILMP